MKWLTPEEREELKGPFALLYYVYYIYIYIYIYIYTYTHTRSLYHLHYITLYNILVYYIITGPVALLDLILRRVEGILRFRRRLSVWCRATVGFLKGLRYLH